MISYTHHILRYQLDSVLLRQSINKLINKHMKSLAITIFIVILFVIFGYGWDRHERHECLKWKQQEQDYSLFYSTDWQKEQCQGLVEIKQL